MAWSGARGRVFLFDLDERRPLSFWDMTAPEEGWSDAGGVAVDRDFNIYVADTVGDRVRRFTAFGKEVGALGLPMEHGEGSVRRDRPGRLDRPRDVAVFGTEVFVACGERRLRRGVQRFEREGAVHRSLASFGDPQERFGAPQGIHVGEQGIFVADTLHGCVQRFKLHGPFVGRVDTSTTPDERSRPVAVTTTADRDLLVVDHGDVPGLHRFSLNGEALPAPPGFDGIEDPEALCRDGEGRIYVLDRFGDRVCRLSADLATRETLVSLDEVEAL